MHAIGMMPVESVDLLLGKLWVGQLSDSAFHSQIEVQANQATDAWTTAIILAGTGFRQLPDGVHNRLHCGYL